MSQSLTFIEQLALKDNLYWAWGKVKRAYRPGDFWFDEIEVARFESSLDEELSSIARQFRSGSFRTSAMRPLPHPKQRDSEGNPQTRPTFSLSVRDQVAWVAFVNIIGPGIDHRMPAWSYGHRLYRPVWYEEEWGKRVLKVGWYRHTRGEIYRLFRHSWPLFRSHVYLTVRGMNGRLHGRDDTSDLSQGDLSRFEQEFGKRKEERLPYLRTDYWTKKINTPYWAALDFKGFYPSINRSVILQNIERFVDQRFRGEVEQIMSIAGRLLDFRLNLDGFSRNELDELGIRPTSRRCEGIPTGLMVAGFLSNVAMLGVDLRVGELLVTKYPGRVAHFRFVDDHIVLADTFETLERWIDTYDGILRESRCGARFNADKTAPKELGTYISKKYSKRRQSKGTLSEAYNRAKLVSELDPRFPSPLMTSTLALVSGLAREKFQLLNDHEQLRYMGQIEHLLLADIDDDEMREDTRLAFAASIIARHGASRIMELRRQEVAQDEWEQSHPEGSLGPDSSWGRRRNDESLYVARYTLQCLLKALHEHPYKLRLWLRTLQFCQRVGSLGLEPIRSELETCRKQNPLTAAYLRALVNQLLARLVVACGRTIVSTESSHVQKDAAGQFLLRTAEFHESTVQGPSAKYFEVAAKNLLGLAFHTVKLILSEEQNARSLGGIDLPMARLPAGWTAAGSESWAGSLSDFSGQRTEHIMPLAWWADGVCGSVGEIDPSAVWRSVNSELDNQDRQWIPFLLKYPTFLQSQHVRQVMVAQPRSGSIRGRPAWHVELLLRLKARKALPDELLEEVSSNFRRLINRELPVVSLYDWAEFIRSCDTYDPRGSEWTSLRIISGILVRTRFDKTWDRIHPCSCFVKKDWLDPFENLTWLSWKQELDKWYRSMYEKKCPYAPKWARLYDHRYTVRADLPEEYQRERTVIHSIGTLLLGLLRKSFSWPSGWNQMGRGFLSGGVTHRLLEDTTCSSMTRSIIEACLLPRPKETFLYSRELVSIQPEGTDIDTIVDPPPIYTSEQLQERIRLSIQVLDRYRLFVREQQPRQLIPINLDQLAREYLAVGRSSDE